MSRKRRLLARGALLGIAGALLLLPAQAVAAAIPPGDDYFETDPQATSAEFTGPTQLPQNFFDLGSDPFTGLVKLGGMPINPGALGDTDTVVRRNAQAIVSPGGPGQQVPIEIVQLSLVSVEPITVTYNGGQRPEFWDVKVGLEPVQPPGGMMTIFQTSNEGGTFNTDQLPVQVIFTFTRLSDRKQVTQFGFANFRSQNTPWRTGCAYPALPLNNVFCPGLTPDKRKLLTQELALLASHGVYPAQPNVEHFKCYKVGKQGFKRRKVTLVDQFGQRGAKAKRRAEFCNPVQKNQEVFQNRKAHLQCYQVGGPALGVQVATRNQFGSQRLQVLNPQRLCLPTRKKELPRKKIVRLPVQSVAKQKVKKTPKITVPIDHYQCYGVQPTTPLRTFNQPGQLTLLDQFRRETVQLGDPFRLCAPVAKNKGFIQHPVRHLLCYRIRSKKLRQPFGIQNQFERRVLITRKPQSLCVPTLKTRL